MNTMAFVVEASLELADESQRAHEVHAGLIVESLHSNNNDDNNINTTNKTEIIIIIMIII